MRASSAKKFSVTKLALFCSFLAFLTALDAQATQATARELPAQSIKPAGTTFNRAQVLEWIGDTTFAIGRWDGTISIFRLPSGGEFGPVAIQAMAAPSGRGIEMLASFDDLTFLGSDGPDRLVAWRRSTITNVFTNAGNLSYDKKFGSANSATTLTMNAERHLVTGHENGFVLVWRRQSGTATAFDLVLAIDVHSANPIPSPFPLRNVRGLAIWRDHIVAGSEDGDIVGLRMPDGQEAFRVRYNEKAQRGVNSLSVLGDWLLLANCSVGQADKNVWLYNLSSGKPTLRDSENLALDTQRSQVFNFSAILVSGDEGPVFFSSTEEGLLWQGKIDDDQLVVTGVTKVASDGGAILSWSSKVGILAAAAHQIWLFKNK